VNEQQENRRPNDPDHPFVGSGKKPRIPDKEARAVWLLFQHPELTNQEIADAVGCCVRSLCRMPLFRKLRGSIRKIGYQNASETLPRNGRQFGFEPVSSDVEEDFNLKDD
jgi:hypothetical protein